MAWGFIYQQHFVTLTAAESTLCFVPLACPSSLSLGQMKVDQLQTTLLQQSPFLPEVPQYEHSVVLPPAGLPSRAERGRRLYNRLWRHLYRGALSGPPQPRLRHRWASSAAYLTCPGCCPVYLKTLDFTGSIRALPNNHLCMPFSPQGPCFRWMWVTLVTICRRRRGTEA